MTDAFAVTSSTAALPPPEVLRLESSAQPMNYEVYFDLEPHVAAVEEWQSQQEQMPPAADGNSPPERSRSFHRMPPTKFRGQTKIHLAASTNLRALTLHALDLDIESIAWAVRSEADEEIAPEDVEDPGASSDRSPSNAAGGADPDAPTGISSTGGPSTNNLVDLDPDVAGNRSLCNAAGSQFFQVPEAAHSISEWKIDPATETVRFELGETIAENRQIVVFVSYTGKVHRTSQGLFMSDPQNDPFAVATHLEPTNARRLYPCLDEPSFGARFTLTVRAPEKQHYVLLGNTRVYSTTTDHGTPVRAAHQHHQATPAQSHKTSTFASGGIPSSTSAQHLDGTGGDGMPTLPEPLVPSGATAPQQPASVGAALGDSTSDSESASTATAALCSASAYRLHQFHTTPVMPSYLVAFVFARLHSISAETKSGVVTRVFLPLNEPLENAWFTLDLAKKAIEFFEGYFDFPLPMRKLDVVSVRNVEFLAMENWGLLFFHQDYVPVSESTPLERQQRIARLVGHEVAHQWFGNLVALKWWRYIWLKEGLARYLEYVFTHTTFPKWEMWLHFVSDIQNNALIADASTTKRHPVEQGTGLHPREITKLFDAISYGKAASIMRMAAHSIGGEFFMTAALKQFIHRHAYSSATSEDMFACLAEQYARATVGSKSPLPNFAVSSSAATNSIGNTNTSNKAPGIATTTIEDMLSTWVSTVGPACILVRADKAMDELSAPAIGPQLNLSIRVYACADASTGFTPAIANRPVSPQTRHDDFDPLLGGKRDRSNNSTRPSSVLVKHEALLRPIELPIPVLASVVVGGVCLPPEYVGVCEGHDTVVSASVMPATSGESAPGSTTAAGANAASASQANALESAGMFNGAAAGDDGANGGNPLQSGGSSTAAATGGDRGVSPPQVEGPISLIANASCHAPCRVDYDSVLWWRAVQTVMHRPVKERLGIAMNLFEQRTTLVGVLDEDEELDRCMLLLRFLFELGHHRETHAAMWGYMIDALSDFITLIQDQPCWPEVRLLIIFSQRHLLSARTIGFPAAPAPKDPVLDYNASHDMSSKNRATVLHSLARCGETEVVADAKAYVEWILSAFEDKTATANAAVALNNDAGSSNANAIGGTSAGPTFGGGSFLEAGEGLGDLGSGGGGLAASPPSPMQFAPPTHLADVACALDDLPMDYVSIAFEAAIANSDDARLWWATLQLLSYIMVGDANGLNLTEAARASLPQEQYHIDAKGVNGERKQMWLDALFPAVLALPLSEVRTAQIEVLQKFNSLNMSSMRVLFENSNLLIKFIESTTRAHPAYSVLQSARKFAKRYSANALVATLLAEHERPVDDAAATDDGETAAAAASRDADRSALVPNCVWADYVNVHYSWYIKRHLIHQVAPADASLFSEIASKSLNATSAAAVGGEHSGASDSVMKRCSI